MSNLSNQSEADVSIDSITRPLSVGNYMGMLLLMAIPIVNIIMILIWIFGNTHNINKKNFAIAMVVFIIIMIVATFLIIAFFISMFNTMISMLQSAG